MAKKKQESTMTAKKKNVWDNYVKNYIRMRDCDANGYGQCVSCGKVIHYKDGDAGHYLFKGSTWERIRFEEDNLGLQCKKCNTHLSGNITAWFRRVADKYGYQFASGSDERLRGLCHNKDGSFKPFRWDKEKLQKVKDYYKPRLKKVKERVV